MPQLCLLLQGVWCRHGYCAGTCLGGLPAHASRIQHQATGALWLAREFSGGWTRRMRRFWARRTALCFGLPRPVRTRGGRPALRRIGRTFLDEPRSFVTGTHWPVPLVGRCVGGCFCGSCRSGRTLALCSVTSTWTHMSFCGDVAAAAASGPRIPDSLLECHGDSRCGAISHAWRLFFSNSLPWCSSFVGS